MKFIKFVTSQMKLRFFLLFQISKWVYLTYFLMYFAVAFDLSNSK